MRTSDFSAPTLRVVRPGWYVLSLEGNPPTFRHVDLRPGVWGVASIAIVYRATPGLESISLKVCPLPSRDKPDATEAIAAQSGSSESDVQAPQFSRPVSVGTY